MNHFVLPKRNLSCLFMAFLLIHLGSFGQNVKPFTKRTGVPVPPQSSYTLKGDFSMLGNTSMTLVNYSLNQPNSNNLMRYVDEDGDPNTVNSSRAELKFESNVPGFNAACSRIVFAGLYWTGRTHDGETSPISFPINTPGPGTPYNQNTTVTHTSNTIPYIPTTLSVDKRVAGTRFMSHNQPIQGTPYTLNVTSIGSPNSTVRYTFTAPSLTTHTFEYRNSDPWIRYSTDGGDTWTNPAGQTDPLTDGLSGGGGTNQNQVSFTPVILWVNNGDTLRVDRLERDIRDRTETQYRTDSYARCYVRGTVNQNSPNGIIDALESFPRYTFVNASPDVIFEFRNRPTNPLVFSTNNGATFSDVPGTQTITTDGGNTTVTLGTQSTLYTGPFMTARNVSFTRNSAATGTVTVNDVRTANAVVNVQGSLKTLDKRKVKFKKEGKPYETIVANDDDIFYPTDDFGQVYSAYGFQFEGGIGDVTSYVKQNGLGNYWVADMALREGNGGNTGFFGCWSLVVIYENSLLPLRSISVFDGHSFIRAQTADTEISQELNISGFQGVPVGPVNIKLGLMAGEGDRTIGVGAGGAGTNADFLEIKDVNGNFQRLSHPLNAIGNFFNSSIFTGTNDRLPILENNTGIDVATFNLPNTNNSLIGNNQTSVNFRYGTAQDLYTLSTFVFAVDTYEPEVLGLLTLKSINGVPNPANLVALPGQDLEYTVDIKNFGNEPVSDFIVRIPIPFGATYESIVSSFIDPLVSPNIPNPQFEGGSNSIIWNVGTLPKPADPNTTLLSFRIKLKATTNCSVLRYPDCARSIVVEGNLNGKGAFSGNFITNQPLAQGFQEGGACGGNQILDPIKVAIDGADYVNENCPLDETDPLGNIEVVACPEPGSNGQQFFPVSEVAESFPSGTRFFDRIRLPRTEFTDPDNPFPVPAAGESVVYYAFPPGLAADCFIPFKIVGCTRQIFVNVVPRCINNAPYLDYQITANYSINPATVVTIQWNPGNQAPGIAPSDIVAPIPVAPVSGGLSGSLLWPGSGVGPDNFGNEWPGWVFRDGQWFFEEDGYSWYRNGTITFKVSSPSGEINDTEVTSYPASTPDGCNPGPSFKISGVVLNDVNGKQDNEVNGPGTNAGGLLNAVLVNDLGNVVAVVPVQPTTGAFEFSPAAGTYTVLITTQNPAPGSSSPGIVPPPGWKNTAEKLGAGTGDDLSPDGSLSGITINNANTVANLRFGIQELPTAGSGKNAAVNPGGTILIPVDANTFTNGNGVVIPDPSKDPAPGSVIGIRITAFPAGATTIVVDGVPYNASVPAEVTALTGLFIPTDGSGNPTVPISVDPDFTGSGTVSISFKAIDNAKFESDNTGTALLNLTAPVFTTDPLIESECIDDAPFLNYELTTNFNPTGKKLTIRWQASGNYIGIEDIILPGTGPIAEVIKEIDPITPSMVTNNGDGTWKVTGVDLWPGAVLDASNNILDWPGWVLENGVWLFKEDGYGQYRNGPVITFSINPDVTSDPADYPPPTPNCSSNPPSVSITGKVFNDADALKDTKVDGDPYSLGDMKAVLVNSSNIVAAIAPVLIDGSFSFLNVSDGTYSLRITRSSEPVSPGDAPPAVVLPAGWVPTGEDCCDDSGDDGGTPDDIINGIVISGSSVANVHFGIQQPPNAGNGANSVKNPGGDIQVLVPANTFSNGDGTTLDPSKDPAPGTVTGIRITRFPTGVESIVINSITYLPADLPALTSLIIETNGDGEPTWEITVDPTASGLSTVEIPFVAIDNGGFVSSNEGKAVLNLTPYPDLSPTILLPSNTFNPNEVKNVLLYAVEVNNWLTAPGVSAYGLTVPAGYEILPFDGNMTEMTPSGGGSNENVNNKDFEVLFSTATQLIFKAKTGVVVEAFNFRVLGVQVRRTTAVAGSVSNMTLGVIPDPSLLYDSNNLNNINSRILNAQ